MLRNGATGSMPYIQDCDVPELIEALADRFSEHGIAHREARHITIEMLAHAFAQQAEIEAATLIECGAWIWTNSTTRH